MKRNQRLYDVLRSCGHDMAVLCLPENVVHASGMVTLPNIYAVGFFNWSLPLATAIINVRDEKEGTSRYGESNPGENAATGACTSRCCVRRCV